MITGIWLSFTLPIINPELSGSLATLSAFAGQFIVVMVGYAAYLLATKTMSSPQKQVSVTKPPVALDKTQPS